MRWIWIATGLIMVVLAAAALLRPPAPPAPLPTEPANEELAARPQPLDAGDIAQLVALRNEIGRIVPGADSQANSATFEQELRELAGLPQAGPSPVGEASPEPLADAQNVLRNAAVALEALAAQDENAANYAAADERRLLADQLRRVARHLSNEDLANEELRTAENPPQSGGPATSLD